MTAGIDAAEWVENRPSRGWRAVDLRELWAYRELVGFLAWRDVKARYKQAVLGVAWSVIQPVVGTVVLVLVYSRLIGVPSDGISYPLFALLGFATWGYVSGTVGSLTHSLLSNSELVTKVYFPRMAVPVAALVPGLVDLVVALVVLAGLMAIEGVGPPVAVLLLPLTVLFAMVVCLGIGLWLATLNVLYRDVGHAVGFGIQLWFFASPVAYPSSLVPDAWGHVYALNPVTGLIDAARASVLGGPLSPIDLGISVAAASAILAGGVVYFQRLERRFADVI